MIRDGHEEVSFFIGTEVEHTPAFGMLTLFVVGVHSQDAITQAINTHYALGGYPITHVYFGANQSFPGLDKNDFDAWHEWESMIQSCLDAGWLCTLDLDHAQAEGLLESGLVEHHNFIPMISVKLPYIKQFGYNATLKIDDKDFAATNPGVWCHSLHDLQKREVFTDWSKYTKDEIIK
jgi:hypothetical protein